VAWWPLVAYPCSDKHAAGMRHVGGRQLDSGRGECDRLQIGVVANWLSYDWTSARQTHECLLSFPTSCYQHIQANVNCPPYPVRTFSRSQNAFERNSKRKHAAQPGSWSRGSRTCGVAKDTGAVETLSEVRVRTSVPPIAKARRDGHALVQSAVLNCQVSRTMTGSA
jgi:hypothetical protein